MKETNIEKRKRENKRLSSGKKDKKSELFDFENLKESIKMWFIRFVWLIVICITVFGIFKIVKWGKVFNQNYIEYSNKSEDYILPTIIGEKKLSTEEIKNIKDFEDKLNKIKLKTISIETATNTNTFVYNVSNLNNNQNNINNTLDNNFAIKINFERKVEDSWNTFVSVFLSKDIKESDKDKLEYIDIRYTSKVFYKLKSDKKLDLNAIATTTNNN